MYHFTFIDEASVENERENEKMQEKNRINLATKNFTYTGFFQKTADFLHQYFEQPNCGRIFISKNNAEK